jgi:uncharacterized membrane protein YozB (DUF420 family)
MSIACAVVILIGFASKYIPHLQAGRVPGIIHVHAAIFTAWLALFITQATLIRRDRIDLHRRLGTAGVVLAAVMLVVGVQVSLAVTRGGDRGIPGVEFPEPSGFLLLNLMAVGVFAVLVAAGWLCRNNAQAHKRLMLLATISLTPPGIGRLPVVAPHGPAVAAVAFAFFLAGPIYDLVTRRRIHRAYLGVLLLVAGAPPVVAGLAGTAAWHRLAALIM